MSYRSNFFLWTIPLSFLLASSSVPLKAACTNSPGPTFTTSLLAGPPTQLVITIRDTAGGLASIVVTQSDNADTPVPPFTVGTTDPVTVTATRIDQSRPFTVSITATDTCGNQTVFSNSVPPPIITKTFGAASVGLGGSTTLTFKIENTAVNAIPLNGIGFTDTLPSGLSVATPNGIVGSCGGGTISAVAASNVVSLSGASLGANATCSFSVNVIGNSPGVKNNSVTVSSANGGQGNTSNASLTVTNVCADITRPVVSTSMMAGPPAQVVFTVQDTGSGIASVVVTQSVNADTPVPPFTVGTISPIFVTSTKINQTQPVLVTLVVTDVCGNTTTFSVGALPPSISKAFGATSIALGTSTSLTFTVSNPAGNADLTGIAFTDALPSGLVVATPNGSSTTCATGTVSAIAGSSSVSLTGGALTAGTSCTISVNVNGATAGSKTNSVTVSSTNGGLGNTSAAALVVVAPPTLTKVFGATTVDINGLVPLTFMLSNPNAVSLTGVNFSDTLPAGLAVSATSGLPNGNCGGTLSAAGNLIMLSGVNLAASGTCTFSVNVTGVTAGPQVNITSAIGSVEGGTGLTATAAIAVAPVVDTLGAYQVRYVSNLGIGDSVIDITNTGGSSTTALPTQNGNLCVNVYAFSPDEQLVSCCSCLVTPNGVVALSARNDLISNTLTPGVPTSIVVKLLASSQATCNASTVTPASLALSSGLAAWATSLHAAPVTAGTPTGTYGLTETPFTNSTLSVAELTRITSLCGFNQVNGSGFGICKACRLGGLGADRQ